MDSDELEVSLRPSSRDRRRPGRDRGFGLEHGRPCRNARQLRQRRTGRRPPSVRRSHDPRVRDERPLPHRRRRPKLAGAPRGRPRRRFLRDLRGSARRASRLRLGPERQRVDRGLPLERPRGELVYRPDDLDALRSLLRRGHHRGFSVLELRNALSAHRRCRPVVGRARDAFHRERAPRTGPRRALVRLRRLSPLSQRRRRHVVDRRREPRPPRVRDFWRSPRIRPMARSCWRARA